ncbi:MAG: DUF1326 domain-containing protein [Pseudomonadota bacterium]|nr:DUF1326 domain-containing protein [Pseudomonadota bacterium]
MCTTVHPPLFGSIEFDVDIEARQASVRIAGVLKSSWPADRQPATGEEHRVRIDLPNGIEFDIAEIGSGTTEASGAIRLELDDTFGQFNMLRQSGRGIVRGR